jgi:hypothetical protein
MMHKQRDDTDSLVSWNKALSLGVPYQEGEHICVETQSTNTKNGFALIESNDELVRQTHKENINKKFYY